MGHSKNIAVLYDIENLVGGFNFRYLSEISLNNILNELKSKDLGDIATQKAYADWSNYKLQSLKWEIAELGIEPIQMYGFSKASTKNASDIQLVIDAMEILHTKAFIDTFILVSGDGGFSSLAKKLSEYGKKVIGCAYQKSTNTIFSQVCDDFIYIEETFSKEQLNVFNDITMDENKKKQINENPLLKNSLHKIKPIETNDFIELENQIKLLINELKISKEAKYHLKYDGLNISVFKSALNYVIVNFDYICYGFPKLVDFVRYILFNTGLKLVLKEPSDYRIVFEEVTIYGFNDIEFLKEIPKLHSKNSYEVILSTKKPVIKLPENRDIFNSIIEEILKNKEEYKNRPFEDILKLFISFDFEEKDIRNTLYFLINSSILIGDNSSLVLSEQSYYFKAENYIEVQEFIRQAMINKLNSVIKIGIDTDIVEHIITDIFNLKE